ncbi:MAG: diguanylate cyclase [Pseudobutyrivibrio sp.]|nr:diguanylate cyclase [Pseudobutyrivibrio sp.]
MKKTKFNSFGLLIGLCFLAVLLAVTSAILIVIQENTLNVRTEYVEISCKEKAKEIDEELVQIEGMVNSMHQVVMTYLSTSPTGDLNEDLQASLEGAYGALFTSTMAEFDYISASFLRFNPDITSDSAGVAVMRVDGKPQQIRPPSILGYEPDDIAHVGWYYVPVEYGEGVWMEPYYNDILGRECMTYVVPIIYNEEVIGVLGMDMNISELQKFVEGIKILDGYASILTQSNNTIGNTLPMEDANYYTAKTRLSNNMTLCITVDTKDLYPIRHGNAMKYLVVGAFVILVALIMFVIINLVTSLSYENNNLEQGNKYVFGIALVMMVVFISQIGLVSYQLVKVNSNTDSNIVVQPNKGNRPLLKVTGDDAFLPYSYENEDGTPTGCDVEIIYKVADEIGMDVYLELMPWDEAVAAVESGEYDVLLGVDNLAVYDQERINTTRVIAQDSFALYGKEPINTISEVRGRNLGSIYGLEDVDVYNLQEQSQIYDDYESEMEALNAGVNEYSLVRSNVANFYIANRGYDDLIQVYDIIESRMTMGVNAEKTVLLDAIDKELSVLSDKGTIAAIQKKWFGDLGSDYTVATIIREYATFFRLTFLFIVILLISIIWVEIKLRMMALKSESDTDALTGIYNRRGGENQIQLAMDAGKKGMFCLLDIDKFKSINDTFGHDAGDIVLKRVATCMKDTFREKDIVMRLGGDEFVVFVPDVIDRDAAERVIERFFGAIDAISIEEIEDRKIMVSLGATFFLNESGETYHQVYTRADSGTYESKKVEGRSFYTIK